MIFKIKHHLLIKFSNGFYLRCIMSRGINFSGQISERRHWRTIMGKISSKDLGKFHQIMSNNNKKFKHKNSLHVSLKSLLLPSLANTKIMQTGYDKLHKIIKKVSLLQSRSKITNIWLKNSENLLWNVINNQLDGKLDPKRSRTD